MPVSELDRRGVAASDTNAAEAEAEAEAEAPNEAEEDEPMFGFRAVAGAAWRAVDGLDEAAWPAAAERPDGHRSQQK